MMFNKEALTSITIALLAMVNESQASFVPATYGKLKATVTNLGIALPQEGITVFAPTDAAFDTVLTAVPEATFDYNKDLLTKIVEDHVLGKVVKAADLPADAETLTGKVFNFDATKGVTYKDEVLGKISGADVVEGEAYLHEVDTVLVADAPAATIAELATNNGLTKLVEAITAFSPELLDAAKADALDTVAFTVFAPTNDAFDALFAAVPILNKDSANRKEAIDAVLKHHVISGTTPTRSSDLQDGDNLVTTLLGTELTVNKGEKVTIGDATVVAADARSWGAVAHVIDQVLIPDAAAEYVKTVVDVAAENKLETLTALLGKAELVGALKGIESVTVFAPLDTAFGKLGDLAAAIQNSHNADLLDLVLKYHVVAGASATGEVETLAGANVTIADKVTTGAGQSIDLGTAIEQGEKGIQEYTVYAVDTVLLPAGVPAATIADLAVAAKLDSLVAALTRAELVGVFSKASSEPLTVFAPSNEAFTKFLDGKKLEDIKVEDLEKVLKYHVVKGAVTSKDLKTQEYETLSGDKIMIDVSKLEVNGAKITGADNRAFNGYVHLIDAVLTPKTAGEEPEGESGASTVTTAVAAVVCALFAAIM